jgi:hypothetical protein
VFRKRQKRPFTIYFSQEGSLVYCSNANYLMGTLGYQHDQNEWTLIYRFSYLNLKALLFIENKNIQVQQHVLFI